MWIYRQSSGELFQEYADGTWDLITTGYSGSGAEKNHPEAEAVAQRGPIPRGFYTIGDRYDSESHGPLCMHLTPASGQPMHGRSAFLIHGDSVRAPGTASHGCIIIGRKFRDMIARSTDRDLKVIA